MSETQNPPAGDANTAPATIVMLKALTERGFHKIYDAWFSQAANPATPIPWQWPEMAIDDPAIFAHWEETKEHKRSRGSSMGNFWGRVFEAISKDDLPSLRTLNNWNGLTEEPIKDEPAKNTVSQKERRQIALKMLDVINYNWPLAFKENDGQAISQAFYFADKFIEESFK